MASNSYVYFIRSGARGPIKIGIARDVGRRLATLQTASPTRLRLIGAIPGGEELEKALHTRLAEFRISGEWFEPTADVRRWARMAEVIDGRYPDEVDIDDLEQELRKHFRRHKLSGSEG